MNNNLDKNRNNRSYNNYNELFTKKNNFENLNVNKNNGAYRSKENDISSLNIISKKIIYKILFKSLIKINE